MVHHKYQEVRPYEIKERLSERDLTKIRRYERGEADLDEEDDEDFSEDDDDLE